MDEPAFPTISNDFEFPQSGMTLRDYFAARAMHLYNGPPEELAEYAYRIADAMLKERSKKQEA